MPEGFKHDILRNAGYDGDFYYKFGAPLKLLNELNNQRKRDDWQPHPAFGKLSKEQWGKMQYKHLDHHLRQFGV